MFILTAYMVLGPNSEILLVVVVVRITRQYHISFNGTIQFMILIKGIIKTTKMNSTISGLWSRNGDIQTTRQALTRTILIRLGFTERISPSNDQLSINQK
jgi:hypothetical protein